MMWNKQGSVTIYVLLFFLTLVSMLMTFVNVSKTLAVGSVSSELALLWSDNILAEYDRNLQSRYNLFAYYGTEKSASDLIDYYAEETFGGKSYLSYEGSTCVLYDYKLRTVSEMKKQVIAAGKLAALSRLSGKPGTITGLAGAEKGGNVMTDLPSAGCGSSWKARQIVDMLKNTDRISTMIRHGTDPYFENRYILHYFKNAMNDHALGATHLNQEMEYILCGKPSDSENQKSVKRRIIAIRLALNLWYLETDPKRSSELLAAAELLTPGPAAPATQAAMASAWAMAESVNDYKLLINGRKIPIIKTESTWAISLNNITGKAKVHPKHDSEGTEQNEEQTVSFPKETPLVDMDTPYGENYEDYLSLMTYMMDEDVKLLRMMDLIQMNMRDQYYAGFRIEDYNTGIRTSLKVNGKDYTVERRYERQ